VNHDIANPETPIGVASKGGKTTVTRAVVIWWELSQEGQRMKKEELIGPGVGEYKNSRQQRQRKP
jgi:hypothetical protein